MKETAAAPPAPWLPLCPPLQRWPLLHSVTHDNFNYWFTDSLYLPNSRLKVLTPGFLHQPITATPSPTQEENINHMTWAYFEDLQAGNAHSCSIHPNWNIAHQSVRALLFSLNLCLWWRRSWKLRVLNWCSHSAAITVMKHTKRIYQIRPPGWYRNTAHLFDSCLHCFTFMHVYVSVICQEFQFMPLLVSSPTLNLDIWLPWLQERAFCDVSVPKG